jgi:hypothetical protein
MIDEKARKTAAQCRHYAMCKIDYLDTGLCPSGPERHYVAFYPQGRMDLYRALAEGPPDRGPGRTRSDLHALRHLRQAVHFVTRLRPVKVMEALEAHVSEHLAAKARPQTEEDETLKRLQKNHRRMGDQRPGHPVHLRRRPVPLAGIRCRVTSSFGSRTRSQPSSPWPTSQDPAAIRGSRTF